MRKPLLLALIFAGPAFAATLPPRKPGLWQTTMTMTMTMNGHTMAGPPMVSELCSTPQVDAVEQQRMAGGHCGTPNFVNSGGSYTYAATCPAPNGVGTITIHGTLTMDGDTAGHMVSDSAGPQYSGHMVADAKWLGPCPAGMAPGDRGHMVNGTFVKTGNVLNTP